MNNKYLVLAVLAVVLFLGTIYFVSSQPAALVAAQKGETENTIVASGEFKVSLKPDRAILTFGVLTEGRTAQEAQRENAKRVEAVVQAVKGLGIEEKDVQTSGLNLQPKYEYRQNKAPVIVGYQSTVNLTLKTGRVEGVGEIVDAVIAAGANTLNGVRFTVKDVSTVKEQGIDAAIDRARAQAERMAGRLGVKVIGVKSMNIRLVGGDIPPIIRGPYALEEKALGAALAEFSGPVMPGEEEFTVVADGVFLVEN